MMEKALKWLRKSWYGAFIAYFLVLGGVYVAVWTIGEPAGIPDKFESLPDFVAKSRFFFHLLLSIIIAAHIITVLLVAELNFSKHKSSEIYGIKIQHPSAGDEVNSPFEISGTYKVKPPRGSMRVLEFSPISHHYWAKNNLVFDERNRTWSSVVHIGGNPGEKREVIIAYFDENGKALFDYFLKAANDSGNWLGIDTLTNDVEECDRLTVRRKT